MIHFADLMNLVGFLIAAAVLIGTMLFVMAWASDAKAHAEDRILRNVRDEDDAKDDHQ